MRDVLVIKPSALGDIIQSTCILPMIRKHSPDARISWLVFKHNSDILINHPLIDHLFIADRHANFFSQIRHLGREMRRHRFDLVIDLQSLFRSGLFSLLSGGKRRVGYANGQEGSTLFYTETYDIPTRSMHAVDGYIKLCEALGMESAGQVDFPLPINKDNRKKVRQLLSGFPDDRPLITISPSARWATKCWPERHFASLGDWLIVETGAKIALVGSPDEQDVAKRVSAAMKYPVLDLTGRLSLLEVGALLEMSDLFVGNDSGLMHMASATKTRTVAIFGPTDPRRTGPYNPLATTVQADLECMPCFRKRCRGLLCMEQVDPRKVGTACLSQLQLKISEYGG
jgi:lipopolysaccharide heptosyltransferase I